MKLFIIAITLASAVAVSVSASPVDLNERATCVYTCGSVCYWQEDIDEALTKGYSLYESDTPVNSYPHQYNNYEGFSFPTSAPWYEFPILSSYVVYTGRSPGADRIIFDSNGNLDSLITHTGASGNNFKACIKN
ncbi:guanyl-specific ribonuclease [Apodospora peruviana]|uniref:ribonuclease T1 n=1 Tax=Apodospora peruviana TaxID=516989 RepID=A0AAE0MBZ4_9PEZI|nr:guanyl-specific ribonuclease [Apodospora peruviana]